MLKKIIALLFLVLIVSCDVNTPQPFVPHNNNADEDMQITSNLFTAGNETGTIIFKTNDPQYYSNRGSTLLDINAEQVEEDFVSREVELAKLSGNAGAGYGLVCGYRNDPVYGETMLVILINIEREYLVTEITGYARTDVIPWKESLFLNRGYNQRNAVRVEFEGGQYGLYINGELETVFRDDKEPFHTKGRNGYMVVISPLDDFPNVPVEVRFKEMEEG